MMQYNAFAIYRDTKRSTLLMISKVGERATGYGVSLLNSLFGTASKAALLQAASPGRDNGALGGEDRGPSQGQTKKPRIE